jgi:hypothetical protein
MYSVLSTMVLPQHLEFFITRSLSMPYCKLNNFFKKNNRFFLKKEKRMRLT